MAVDLGSVGRAATALGVTQSALSKRLKSLEAVSGEPLLTRSSAGVQPTAAGRAILSDARRAIAQLDALETRLATLGAVARPVRVASSPGLADRVVPAAIGLLPAGGGSVPVELLVANSAIVRDAVAERRADIGIAAADLDEDLSSTGRLLADDELVAVVPPDHPWAALDAVPAAELAVQPLVLRDPGSHVRRTLDRALAAGGLELQTPVAEVGNPAAVKAAIRAHSAPGILSRYAVDPATDGLVIRPVSGVDLRRRYWVITSPDASADAHRVGDELIASMRPASGQ